MNYLTQRQKLKSNSQNSIQILPYIVTKTSQDLIKKKSSRWSIADSQRRRIVQSQESLIDNHQSPYRVNQTARLDISSQRQSMQILDLTLINRKQSQATLLNSQIENQQTNSISANNYIKELEEFLKEKDSKTQINNSCIIEKVKRKQGKLDRKHLILKLMKTNLNSTHVVQKQKWNEILYSQKLDIQPKQIRQTENLKIKIQTNISCLQFFKHKSVS